jgi:hypothetical protein
LNNFDLESIVNWLNSQLDFVGVASLLGLATVVSVQMLGAASLERWGRTYGETWALEDALTIQPWRLSADERLALRWAIDGRAGDEPAAARAREVIGDAVRAHPWDPDVRFWAADVETLLRDKAAAAAWVEQQLARFPADVVTVEKGSSTDLENTFPGA